MKGGFNQGFLLMSRLPNVYYHLLGGLACVQLVDILKSWKKINVFMVKTKILNYFFIISLNPQHKKLMRKSLFEFINSMFIENSSKGKIFAEFYENFAQGLSAYISYHNTDLLIRWSETYSLYQYWVSPLPAVMSLYACGRRCIRRYLLCILFDGEDFIYMWINAPVLSYI